MSKAAKAIIVLLVSIFLAVLPGCYYNPITTPSTGIQNVTETGSADAKGQGYFKSADGKIRLFYRQWLPAQSPPKGIVFVVHGYVDHSGWYEELASALTADGFAVFAHDHQGWGQSDGDRGHVERFQHFVDDLLHFVDLKTARFPPKTKVFLFGKSMGGPTVLMAAMQHPEMFDGVIGAAPAIVINPKLATPFWRTLAGAFSDWVPKLPVKQGYPPEYISRDPEVVSRFEEDPYCYHGRIRVRFAYELLQATDWVQANASDAKAVSWPFLLLQGTSDKVTIPEGSKFFFDNAPENADKTLKLYEGSYHNLLQDPGGDQVVADILEWLNGKCE
jgi:alpha-beta hydrolase superfamily lysophospholipase